MSFLWNSARKDLRRRLADRGSLLLWIGIPLLISGVMSLALGGAAGEVPRADLLVVDRDASFVSKALSGLVEGAGDEAGLVELSTVELEEGEERLAAGEASGLLVIPEGFAESLLLAQPCELRFVRNPAQRILPDILQEGLEMFVELVFYAQRLFGPQLAAFTEPPAQGASLFEDEEIAARRAAINASLRKVESVLFPPVIALEPEFVVEEKDEPPPGGVGLILFPGVVFMALLFVAQGMSDDLWTEIESGTLRRALASPHGLATVLAGKLLAGLVLIFCLCTMALSLGAVLFEVAPARLPAALLWSTLTGSALLPLFYFLQTLASSRRGGAIVGNVILFPLMMIGGSLVPFEAMPDWMVAIGRWTPNGLAVAGFKDLLTGAVNLGALLRDGALLITSGGVLFFLALWRTQRRHVRA